MIRAQWLACLCLILSCDMHSKHTLMKQTKCLFNIVQKQTTWVPSWIKWTRNTQYPGFISRMLVYCYKHKRQDPTELLFCGSRFTVVLPNSVEFFATLNGIAYANPVIQAVLRLRSISCSVTTFEWAYFLWHFAVPCHAWNLADRSRCGHLSATVWKEWVDTI